MYGPGIQTGITDVSLVTVGEQLFMSLTWNHCCAQLSEGRGLWTSADGLTWANVGLERADGVVQAGATNGDIVVLGGLTGRGAEGVLWVAAR